MTERALRTPCVYIVASKRNGTLYCGVTSDLARRAYEHRTGAMDGFSKRYHCNPLVWYEPHERMDNAIQREKQIKAGSRRKKLELIEAMNPDWRDLYETLNG
jgi:putative endonuclease